MKTLFIIPGFTQSTSRKAYRALKTHFEKDGYTVFLVPISWYRKVMTDYVAQFEECYNKNKGEHNTVMGFSFGAMTAFISAPKLQPDKLILCSLSPYFKEDHHDLRIWWKGVVGANRMKDFERYSANAIAKDIKMPTVLFYGSLEGKKHPMLKARIEAVAKQIPKSKIVMVNGAPHDIGHPEYQKMLFEEMH